MSAQFKFLEKNILVRSISLDKPTTSEMVGERQYGLVKESLKLYCLDSWHKGW